MLKRIVIMALVLILSVSLFAGCTSSDVEQQGDDSSDTPEIIASDKKGLDWIDSPRNFEEWFNNAKITSLTSLGNTHRLKKVIEKARKGEDVTIAYLGGSITQGIGASDYTADHSPNLAYLPLSYKYFCDTFAKKGEEQVRAINAGIGATPSTVGALRFSYDVAAYEPDIVFVEFAVNDFDSEEHRDAFEGVVRHALSLESEPAVILLFSRTDQNQSMQYWMKEIGYHYDVSMISYADGVTYMIENGAMTWEDFSPDFAHPNDFGFSMVADFIAYFYDEVDRLEAQGKADETYERELMYFGRYENAMLLTEDTYTPTETGSWAAGSNGSKMTHGWKYAPGGDNEPIVFEFVGKDAYLIWPGSGYTSYGKISVRTYYNGEKVDSQMINEYNGGWMGPMIQNLYRADKEGNYRIEVSMIDNDVDKDAQILGVAYSKEVTK